MRPSEKGDWIRNYLREHGTDLPYSEISKAAKAAGHGALSKSYVSRVRVEMDEKPKPKPKPKKKAGKRKSAKRANGHDVEQPLTQLVGEVRTARSSAERLSELLNPRGQNGEGTAGAQFLRALRSIGSERGRKLLEVFEAGGA